MLRWLRASLAVYAVALGKGCCVPGGALRRRRLLACLHQSYAGARVGRECQDAMGVYVLMLVWGAVCFLLLRQASQLAWTPVLVMRN